MFIWEYSICSALFTSLKTMFYLWVFDLIWVCWAISGQSKCCVQAKHNQTSSLTSSMLFPSSNHFFAAFKKKHPQPITLHWCMVIDSLLILLFQFIFLPSIVPPLSYNAERSENPQLNLNIVNLFIKQCVQYIFMVHISLVKTFHSIKHLAYHWVCLQRANSSPRLLALLVRGTLSHISQSICHIQP